MRPWRIIMFALVAGSLQTSVMPMIAIGKATPDLFLLGAVSASFALSWEKAALTAGLIGLSRDLFLGYKIGTGAVMFALLGALLGRLRTEMFVDHPITQMAVTMLAGLSIGMIHVLGAVVAKRPSDVTSVVGAAVLSSAYMAAISPLFFILMRKVHPQRRLQH